MHPYLLRPRLILVTGVAAALMISACGGSPDDSAGTTSASTSAGPLNVVAAFYPLAYAAGQVGGDAVTVTNLTPAGAEPHDLELSPQQVAEIAEADLVLYIPGFQPAVDEAVAQQAGDRALDVTQAIALLPAEDHAGEDHAGEDHAGEDNADESAGDPHVWLNPLNMTTIGAEIAARLTAIDPASASGLETNQEAFGAAMTTLNEQWATGTADCTSRDLVVSHEAFGYLAAQYDFTQVGIAGLSPETEPSPARLAEVSTFVRDNGVTTIYYETLVDPRIAETIAAETGATTAVLDPLEGLPVDADGDYVTIMQANLSEVRTGQGCA